MTDRPTFAISYRLHGEPMTHLSYADQLSLEDAAVELFEHHGFVVPEHPLGGRSAIMEQLPATGISDITLREV